MKKKFTLIFLLWMFQMSVAQNYCGSNSNSTEAIITNVQFAEINNPSPNIPYGVPAYEDFTSLVGNVVTADSFTVSVQGNTNGPYSYFFSLFIDWNANGILDDAGEFYDLGSFSSSSGSDGINVSQAIAVPADAQIGQTRMRIIMNWSYSHTDPCGTYGYGQTEDYTLNISEPSLPDYCVPSISNTIAPITKVEFSGINQNSSATSSDAHETFFDIEGLIEKGATSSIKVQGSTLGNFTDHLTAFVDWNKNGILDDASEVFNLGTISNSNGEDGIEALGFITAPADASSGKVLMRIIKNRNSAALDPCGDYPFGQIEDYYVRVANSTYCLPAISAQVAPITRFKLETIDNVSSSSSTNAYEQFFETSTSLRHGDTYEIILEGNTLGNFTDHYSVFIDWNNNGSFQSNEMIPMGSITNSTGSDGQQLIGSITIPYSAYLEELRLRIVKNRGEAPTDPCASYAFGQIEDYIVQILEPLPQEGECQEGITGNFETNLNSTNFMLANDFIVDPLTLFKLDRFIVNLERNQVVAGNFLIMADDSNKPGEVLASFSNVEPQMQIDLGNDYYKVSFYLPSSVDLSGGISGKKYWIAFKAILEDPNALAMMEMTTNVTTSLVHYSLNNGETFSPWGGIDGVITVKGICEDDVVEYCDVDISQVVEPITSVNFGSILNETSAESSIAYENFEDVQTDVEQGGIYEMTLKGNTNGNHTNYFTVFIDWNQNGYLNEEGEVFELGSIANSTGTDEISLIESIQIPANAILGSTKMRIIKNRDFSPIDPCGNYEFGQIEDYSVNVVLESDINCEIHFEDVVAPISHVQFAGIDNESSPHSTSPEHELFLTEPGIGKRGNAYGISIEGNTLGDNTSYITAYFDWNNNGQLDDPGEVYWLGGITNSTGTDDIALVSNITIPLDAALAQIRFRIIKQETNYIPSPCGTFGTGQAEDYLLKITDVISEDDYCMVTISQAVSPITHVEFAGINNSSEDGNFVPSHEYFLDQQAEVQVGGSFPIKVEGSEDGHLSVFIDWNQNNELDDAGEIYFLENGLNEVSFITVPQTAIDGVTRMRIIKNSDSYAVDPCGDYAIGQAEDYSIMVLGENDCTIKYESNNLEDGLGIIIGDFKVANDFFVEPNTSFSITNFIPNIITKLEFGNISIHEDDNGKPGELIVVFNNQTPVSQEFIGTNFWWEAEFYTVNFELPTAVTLEGGEEGKKYWIALGGAALNWPDTTPMSWETKTIVYSDLTYYSNDGGENWVVNDFEFDGVFKLVGICEGINLNCGENYDSNNFELLLNTLNGSANDFDVEPNTTFELTKFSPTIESNVPQVHIQIFSNDEINGGPGNLVREFLNISPVASTLVHHDPDSGFNYYQMDFDLASTYLPGGENGTKYWIAILPLEGQQIILWEMSSIMSTSEPSYNQGYDNTNGVWFWNRIEESYDGVFELEGNCIGEPISDCTLDCPEDITVQAELGETSAIVEYEIDFSCEGIGNTDGLSIALESGLASGSSFPIGTTTIVHNLLLNGEIIDTCSFTVTVDKTMTTMDSELAKLTYYPNPVKDVLNIQSHSHLKEIQILDLTGKRVLNEKVNSKEVELEVRNLITGVYIVKVVSEKGVETFKIIKK